MARGKLGDELLRWNMLIPKSMMDWVQAEADKRNRSKTDIIIEALEEMRKSKEDLV